MMSSRFITFFSPIHRIPHLFVRVFSIFCLLSMSQHVVAATKADSIIGKWKVFSQIDGKLVCTIKFEKDKKQKNTYFARIVSQTKTHTYYSDTCNKCPKPFTNKPVIGMVMLWNVKAKNPNKAVYTGGYGIDPWLGKMFQGSAKVTGRKNNLLKLRGTPIETRWIGQTFTFVRTK